MNRYFSIISLIILSAGSVSSQDFFTLEYQSSQLSSEPFAEESNPSQIETYAVDWGVPDSDVSAPVGDALPFLLLLSAGYAAVRKNEDNN